MINQPWVEKYRPQSGKDIVGNTTAISKIKKWLNNWPKSITRNKRALMLFGPSGVGKTLVAHTLASELGYDITEINATVKRSKKRMGELLKTSTMTGTLTSTRGRVLLVDELAGLSGKSDRGAASALTEHIQKTRVPIILVTNDISEPKIRPLRKISTLIEFEPVRELEIVEMLKRICNQEKIRFEDSALDTLASHSRGDIRAAINDLQSITKSVRVLNTRNVLEFIQSRDQKIDLNEALDRIFYAETWNKAISAANQIDVYPDELIRWISANIPLVFPELKQQAKAFDLLSRASIFSRRINRTQNWRLLPYSKELMCITGTITDGTPTPKRPEYRFPEWIQQMGFSRGVRQKRTLVGHALSLIVHLSAKRAYEEYIIVLKALLKEAKLKEMVKNDLDLSEELVDFILR
ncbi:MAG: replication factor C large subunit [Candidatus Hermodarchaeota archaeon]